MKIKKVTQYHQANYPTEMDIKRKLIKKGGVILLAAAMLATVFTGCKPSSGNTSSEPTKKKSLFDSPALAGDVLDTSEPETDNSSQEQSSSEDTVSKTP